MEPPFGGPELQAIKIARRLKERGHEIFFISKGSGKAPECASIDGIQVYRLNKQGLASVEAAYWLWKLRSSYDVIHVHGVGRLASIAISMAKILEKRVYIKVTTAGHILKPTGNGVKGILKRMSPFRERKVKKLKQADAMISISTEITNELLYNGFNKNKISHIPNGVDTDQFCPVDSEVKHMLRRKLGLITNKKIVLFTGKITKRKGLDTLLEAWGKLKDLHANVLLVLVGSGNGQSDNLEEWISQYITENNLTESVMKVGDVTNVHEYLACGDIFVFPSRREGLPNSLLEAMASGLLCIASDIGGNTDLIIPGETGILAEAGNKDSWEEALRTVIINPNQHFGTAACELINNRYSIDITVEKLAKLYCSR